MEYNQNKYYQKANYQDSGSDVLQEKILELESKILENNDPWRDW